MFGRSAVRRFGSVNQAARCIASCHGCRQSSGCLPAPLENRTGPGEARAVPCPPSIRALLCPVALTLLAVTLLVVTLGLGCGAEDRVAPYSPPPPDCPEADDYLQPLYALEAQGRLTNLATTIRERIPDSARRDLLDALLGLLGAFEDGDFSALARPADAAPTPTGQGIQATLARVLRWLVETGPRAPNQPLTALTRRTLASCEGAPVFALLGEAIGDAPLIDALLETLPSDALGDGLAGLDFEDNNGREALSYLVRNLLVAAQSDTFDVASIVDLLGLIVDLDAPPFADLAAGLERLLDADGLPRLQGFLKCLQWADPDLVLGGFLYDLLTSGLLADVVPDAAPVLSDALRELAQKLLAVLANDAEIRRGLLPALLAFIADDVAPAVLGDIAGLLEADALSGLFDLVIDLASGACRPSAQASPSSRTTPAGGGTR